MARTRQLTYYIYLTDAARVATLQAQFPNGVIRAPLGAADEFGAPFQAETTPFSPPCTRANQWAPGSGSGRFPVDVAQFTISGGGFWGWIGFGSTTYRWVGQFVYTAGTSTVETPPVGNIGARKFIDGFVGAWQDPTATGYDVNPNPIARTTLAAGRSPDDLGWAWRGDNGVAPVFIGHDATELGVALTPDGWERFRLRLRRAPTSDAGFWVGLYGTAALTPYNLTGIELAINSSGNLIVSLYTVVGARVVIGTAPTPLVIGRWHSIDLLWTAASADPGGGGANTKTAARLYIDKVAQSASDWTGSVPTAHPMAAYHIGSIHGTWLSSIGSFDLDLTDHVSIKPPVAFTHTPGGAAATVATIQPTGPDWNHGSRVRRIRLTEFHATNTWAGSVDHLHDIPGGQALEVTSSVSSALLAVKTDAARSVAAEASSIGIACLVAMIRGRQSVAGQGRLGWSINGAANDLATLNESTSTVWSRRAYQPTVPTAITSLVLVKEKAANANASAAQALFASAEILGKWGPEDADPAALPVGPDPTDIEPAGLHNWPYPESPWARLTTAPVAPVLVKAGTYVGNGTAQRLTFRAPVHWLWIRRADGASVTGGRWWSTMLVDHVGGGSGDTPGAAIVCVRVDGEYTSPGTDSDPEARYQVIIRGQVDTYLNAAGNSYQYIAVGDPGMRFMMNTADKGNTGLVLWQPIAFPFATWTPDAAFFWSERSITITESLFHKGPGHAADAASALNAAENTAVARMSAGQVEIYTPLQAPAHTQVAVNAWRMDDGNTEIIDRPVQIKSYVGDGNASRTIALPNVTGRRVLFAIVTPHNAVSYIRDPSMTANRSYASDGTVITTGITGGGFDEIYVGATLNANAITYEVFAIMGCTTAGNGGWSTGECEILYEPALPAEWPQGYTQEELDGTPPDGSGTPPVEFDDGPTLQDDLLSTECAALTLRICNLALARIQVSARIQTAAELQANPAASQAADFIQQFYEHVLRKVLRDFVWQHATRYAELVLVDGDVDDPINGDWTYSFRAPAGMLFARRIIRPNIGRDYDANPPHFKVGADDSGPLIFFKEWDPAETPVELEYTIRPVCAARAAGNATFVSCAAWRLAAELAGPLAKNREIAADCWKEYKAELPKSAANDISEKQDDPTGGDASWILERG